jgi:riboflavin biosynthesis pyrimidine reductase
MFPPIGLFPLRIVSQYLKRGNEKDNDWQNLLSTSFLSPLCREKRKIIPLEPMITLYERDPAPGDSLPAVLAAAYGGGLVLPLSTSSVRPYVFANLVETIDGVVSYNAPGQMGGGMISGGLEQDMMLMGILRAEADAVIFGSSSLHQDTGHVRIPSFIYPPFANEYAALRRQLNCSERLPLSVVMTASGKVDLNEPTFHTPDLRVVIATTQQGYEQLVQQALPPSTRVHIIEGSTLQNSVSPSGTLAMLAREYGAHCVLYEGGPTLLGSFLAEHVINELFLTLAPQMAGQQQAHQRLSLVEGHAFEPHEAPWGTLLSVKRAGSHLFLRYAL